MDQQRMTRPNPENLDVQLERLFDRDHVVRGAAAYALGMLGKNADRDDVLRALSRMARRDWDRKCKINALVALRHIGNPKAVKMLKSRWESLTLSLLFIERWKDVGEELEKTKTHLKALGKT